MDSTLGEALGVQEEVQGMSAPSESEQGVLAGAVSRRIGAVCKSLSNIAYSCYDFGKHGINCVRCPFRSDTRRNVGNHLSGMALSIASIICGLLLLIVAPFVPWGLDYIPFQRRGMAQEAVSCPSNEVQNTVEAPPEGASARRDVASRLSVQTDLSQSGAVGGGVEPSSVSVPAQGAAAPRPSVQIDLSQSGATAGGVGPSSVNVLAQGAAAPHLSVQIDLPQSGAAVGGVGPSLVSVPAQGAAAPHPGVQLDQQREHPEVSRGYLSMRNMKFLVSLVSLTGLVGLAGIWMFDKYVNPIGIDVS